MGRVYQRAHKMRRVAQFQRLGAGRHLLAASLLGAYRPYRQPLAPVRELVSLIDGRARQGLRGGPVSACQRAPPGGRVTKAPEFIDIELNWGYEVCITIEM